MEKALEKKYGLLTAICVVVGTVIGSGVFFKAQTILQKTEGNMPLGIVAWIIGGLIMISCITAFAIMATKYEKNNGLVDYAEATVGTKYGYYIGWFMATIYYPTLTSVLAWLTARYTLVFVTTAFPSITLTVPVEQGGCVVGPECMALSLFFLCFAYSINTLAPKIAGHFQVATTFIKMVPLLLMMIVGTLVGLFGESGTLVENMANVGTSTAGTGSLLFGAVVATAFAYEGWIIATSINSEIKDAKKNLPLALLLGALIVVIIYIIYNIAICGGAPMGDLMDSSKGSPYAFQNIFGAVGGTILNVCIVISCLGTLNGLMLGSTRGLYSISVRNEGPAPKLFAQVDEATNMPTNSAIFGLFVCGAWLVYFYGANLTTPWFGLFSFDSSELPIITIYALYIPMLIVWILKEKEMNVFKRFILPILAIIACLFLVFVAVWSHGVTPFLKAQADGQFSFPVLFYLIIFAVVMLVGFFFSSDFKKLISKIIKK